MPWQPNYMNPPRQYPMPGMPQQLNPLAVFALSMSNSLKDIMEMKYKQSLVDDSYAKKLEMEHRFEMEKAGAKGDDVDDLIKRAKYDQWMKTQDPRYLGVSMPEAKEPSSADRAASIMGLYQNRGANMTPQDIGAARLDPGFMSLPVHMQKSVLPTNDAERQEVEEFNTVQRGGAIADAARTARIPWFKKRTVGDIGEVSDSDVNVDAANTEFAKLEGALPQGGPLAPNEPLPSNVGWTGRARQAMAEKALNNEALPPAISAEIKRYDLRKDRWLGAKNREDLYREGVEKKAVDKNEAIAERMQNFGEDYETARAALTPGPQPRVDKPGKPAKVPEGRITEEAIVMLRELSKDPSLGVMVTNIPGSVTPMVRGFDTSPKAMQALEAKIDAMEKRLIVEGYTPDEAAKAAAGAARDLSAKFGIMFGR